MLSITKINVQNTYPKSITKSEIRVQNNQQKDSVTISTPSFKSKQVLATKSAQKVAGGVGFFGVLGGFFTSIQAKKNARKEEQLKKEEIQKTAEKLKDTWNYTYYRDIPYRAYTDAEAEGIAQFRFDEPTFNDLKDCLEHREDQDKKSYIENIDDVIYLGEKLKEDKELVKKFAFPHANYREAVAILKLHDTNPKEVEELKDKFEFIKSSDIEKILPTYKKYPEKTKQLLELQNELRSLQLKIKTASTIPVYDIDKLPEINDRITCYLLEVLEISPNYIRTEVEPIIINLLNGDCNFRKDPNFPRNNFIPEIEIEDIINAIETAPKRELKNKI